MADTTITQEFQLAGVPRTLAQSGAAVSLTGSTTETTLATINIPADVLGANGSIEVIALFTFPANANSKIPRVKFGGMDVYGQSIANAAQGATQPFVRIANRNSKSAQTSLNVLAGFGNGVPGAIINTTVNTAAASQILITGQLGTATDTLVLEDYAVRYIYGA